jgi:hypothetical protein
MKTMKNRLLASYLMLAAVFLFINVNNANAQAGFGLIPTGISPCTNPPDGPCCYYIQFNLPNGYSGLTQVNITLPGTCWDLNCLQNDPMPIIDGNGQAFAGATVNTTAPNLITVTFNPPQNGPITFYIHVCPTLPCDQSPVGQNVGYTTNANVTWPPGSNPAQAPLTGLTQVPPCPLGSDGSFCPWCNFTELHHSNYRGQDGRCFDQLCFTLGSHSGPSNGPFIITINPPLTPRTTCSASPDCAPNLPNSVYSFDNRFGPPITNDGGATWTVTMTQPALPIQPCETFCLEVPACDPPVYRSVQIVDAGNPNNTCTPTPVVAFKPIGVLPDNLRAQEANYPNPLSRSNDFKTTIPFEMASDGGDARISVFDEAGKAIHTETMSFSGSGKHFFYFTASELPAATYYYTIESPLGVKIVARKLLVVK